MRILNQLLIFSTISCLVSNLLFADVVYLEKDKPAPFSGTLFPDAQARELRVKLLERDYYFDVNTSLQTSLTNYNSIVTLEREKNTMLLEQNTKLIKDYQSMKDTSNVEKLLWFGIGVAATVLSVYGLQQTLR